VDGRITRASHLGHRDLGQIAVLFQGLQRGKAARLQVNLDLAGNIGGFLADQFAAQRFQGLGGNYSGLAAKGNAVIWENSLIHQKASWNGL